MQKTHYHLTYRTIVDDYVLKQTKKKGSIIYGGQAVRGHIGKEIISMAEPRDWDIGSKHPKKDAEEIVKKLNKYYGEGVFKILYKSKYNPEGDKIEIWSVKNTLITPPFTHYHKTDTPSLPLDYPSGRYRGVPMLHTTTRLKSPFIKSKYYKTEKQIAEYKQLTEIDYSYLRAADYEYVTFYNRGTGEAVSNVKVAKKEQILKKREFMVSKPEEYWFRHWKDTSAIRSLERKEKMERLREQWKERKGMM